jgi:hypothetical protein
MELHGEWQRVVLANASLLPKATETNIDKMASSLARLPASDSYLSLLEGGGGGRRLALAGRRPVTRCVPVHELVGRGDHVLRGHFRPRQVERSFVRST